MMLGGLMAPVILAAGNLAWAVGGLGVKIGMLAWQFLPAVMSAMRVVWAVMLANPIGLIVAAVIGLGYAVYKNWDAIVGYINAAWGRIKAVFDINFFDGLIQVWLEAWQSMFNGIAGLMKTVLPDFLQPDAMRNFKFTFATERANNITAAQAAAGKTEVGGTLKIQIDGAQAKVTEVRKAGQAMDIDVSSGLSMMGA